MTHLQYLQDRIWKRIDYDQAFWFQCVDLVRHYMELVHWYKSGTFSGTAFKGFQTWSPFNSNREKKTSGNPKQWDVIFRWPTKANWWSWHVAIVDSVKGTNITVIEQNGVGTGNWLWNNAIRISAYPLSWIIWWYTPVIKIDETAPRSIAIRKAMKDVWALRHTLEACKDHVKQETIDMITDTQKQLWVHNERYRKAGF